MFLFLSGVALNLVFSGQSYADRHCSYARHSLFLADSLVTEKLNSEVFDCPTLKNKLASMIGEARSEIEICWCDRLLPELRLLENSLAGSLMVNDRECRRQSITVARSLRHLLSDIEKCF
jgi:hypothetical protein